MKKLLIALFVLGALASASVSHAATAYFVTIDGVITSTTHKYIKQGIERAGEAGAEVFVIKLDTPGGTLESTRKIVQDIFESPIPVAVYVSPQGARAGSAGTFITLAANYAVMSEGSNIGAAHPVSISGEDIEGTMGEKVINDTVSFMRSIAEKRDRNVDEAILTVTESKSFTASEAFKAGIIDSVVPSDEQLLLMLEVEMGLDSPLTRVDIEPTLTEKIAFGLADPNVLMLLFFLGVLMIFLEFKMPGTFVFAGIGIVAIIAFLIGANFIPINLLGLLLIIIGIGLLIAEIFITSFGLLTVAGLATMVAGMRLLFDTAKTQGVSVSIALLVGIVLFFVAIIGFLGRLIVKDMRREPAVGLSSLVGKEGAVVDWKGNKGHIYVFGELWMAESEYELSKDQEVRVTAFADMVATVVPVEADGE